MRKIRKQFGGLCSRRPKFSEWRTRCTIQVWTMACGKAAVIASGKPFSPPTTAISTSWTYEENQKTIWEIVFPTIGLRCSFITESQNLAPSLPATRSSGKQRPTLFSDPHHPRTSRKPSRVTPKAT